MKLRTWTVSLFVLSAFASLAARNEVKATDDIPVQRWPLDDPLTIINDKSTIVALPREFLRS